MPRAKGGHPSCSLPHTTDPQNFFSVCSCVTFKLGVSCPDVWLLCRMSLLGLFAAQALLLSLAIKLKVAAFAAPAASSASLADDYHGLGLPRHRASDAGGLTAQIRAYLPDLRALAGLQGRAPLQVSHGLSNLSQPLDCTLLVWPQHETPSKLITLGDPQKLPLCKLPSMATRC